MVKTRNEEDVTEWLKKHSNIQYVTRDRSLTYASAIKKGLPGAEQIADKFHLVKNLSDSIAKDVKLEYPKIREQYHLMEYTSKEKQDMHKKISDEKVYNALLEMRSSRYELYKKLQESGLNITSIARRTNTHRTTVAKYLRDGIPSVNRKMVNNYDLFLKEIYLLCEKQMNPSAIYRELVKIGFKGCERSFSRWFNTRFPKYKHKWNRDYCTDNRLTNKICSLPSFKKLTILILNKQYGISKKTGEISNERILVNQLMKKLYFVKDLQKKFTGFREAINGNDVKKMEEWYEDTINHPLRHIRTFAAGLQKDWKAITNAIKYNWNNSLVEGCVNRLKSKKREMYGRAGFEPLRRKVCLSIMG